MGETGMKRQQWIVRRPTQSVWFSPDESAAAVSPRQDGLPDQPFRKLDQIPQGQVNLIPSFKAGLKPAAIARTLGVSQSLVRRVLQSNVGP
jgi:hypothetical protein